MTYFKLLIILILILSIPFFLLMKWLFSEDNYCEPGDLEIPWGEEDDR